MIVTQKLFKGDVCDFLSPSAACQGNKKASTIDIIFHLMNPMDSAEMKLLRRCLPCEVFVKERGRAGRFGWGRAYVRMYVWNQACRAVLHVMFVFFKLI